MSFGTMQGQYSPSHLLARKVRKPWQDWHLTIWKNHLGSRIHDRRDSG